MRVFGGLWRGCCLAAIALLVVSHGSVAEIFRWTDDQGRVHYGERPPPAGAERLDVPQGAAPSRGPDAADEARRARQRRALDAYEYERERRREQAARAAEADRKAAARCSELRKRWRFLSHPGPVYFSQPGGGRDYLNDEQRAGEKDRLRPAYAQACGEDPPL